MDYTKDITNHQKGKHFSLGDRRELQYNVPIVMDSLVGSIESDMGIKAT